MKRVTVALFGDTAVEVAGQVTEITHRKQSTVLALLAAAGTSLSPERLIDQLWDDRPPATARKSLQNHISRLRHWLPDQVLMTEPSGYRLTLERDDIDIHRFTQLIEQARQIRAEGEFDEAAGTFRLALELWTGEPFAGCDQIETLTNHATLLHDLRLGATEELAELDIDRGASLEIVGALEALVREHPLRERLWALLMRALYATGRQAEALDAFRRARDHLVETLGIEPGKELRELEQAVLEQRLDVGGGDASQTTNAAARPNDAGESPLFTGFPPLRTAFFGRSREIEELKRSLSDTRCITLVGTGGVGKTRLACEVARGVASQFRGGAAFVDLAPILDDARLVAAVAQALGIMGVNDDESMPDSRRRSLEAEIHELLGRRPTLVVMDNCERIVERASEFVSHLLDATVTATVLATSRVPLRVDGQRLFPVSPLGLDEAADEEAPAVELLVNRMQAIRPDVDLAAHMQHVAVIAHKLDGLPLALELAAARVSHLSPEQIGNRLNDTMGLLRSMGGGTERHEALEVSLSWSHDLLDDGQRCLFRRLSIFVGGCDLDAIENVCADGLTANVLDLVASLVDHSLLEANVSGPTARYRMLEPIREYAYARLDDADEVATLQERHALYWLGLAKEVPFEAILASSVAQSAQQDNIAAALAWARDQGHPDVVIQLVAGIFGFWMMFGRPDEALRWIMPYLNEGTGLSREAHGKAETLAAGAIYFHSPPTPSALAEVVAHAQRGIDLSTSPDDDWLSLGHVFLGIGLNRSDPKGARAAFEQAMEFTLGMQTPRVWLGGLHLMEGDFEAALEVMQPLEGFEAELEALATYPFAAIIEAGLVDRARAVATDIDRATHAMPSFGYLGAACLAISHAAAGDTQSAWDDLARGIGSWGANRWQIAGSAEDLLVAIGLVHERSGNDDEAERVILASGMKGRMVALTILGSRALERIASRRGDSTVPERHSDEVVDRSALIDEQLATYANRQVSE